MTEDLKETRFTFAELDQIAARCKEEEYSLMLFTSRDNVHLSLEKGSTYGQMHMKFTAEAPTASEAFSKALANFPSNPVGAVWDTKRITQQAQQPPAEDGEFVEAPCDGKTSSTDDDDIPF